MYPVRSYGALTDARQIYQFSEHGCYVFVNRDKLRPGLHNTELAKHEVSSGRNFNFFGRRLPLRTVRSTFHFFSRPSLFLQHQNFLNLEKFKTLLQSKAKISTFFGVLSTTNEFRNHNFISCPPQHRLECLIKKNSSTTKATPDL